MKKLVIAGGTGFLGQVLARHFTRKNWQVIILTRDPHPPTFVGQPLNWNGETLGSWTAALEGAHAIVNLCGKSVDCRYHPSNRKQILDSRIAPTRVLAQAIQKLERPPAVWLNAASATIYRHSLETPMDENHGELGDGFSVDICRAWEAAFFEDNLTQTRRVALRTSMVLGHGKNSVYPILARIARCGMGGKLGSGEQMVSWIHEADFARAVEFAIDDEEISGTLNVTAPAPLRNSVFMRAIRGAVRIPFGLPHYRPMLEVAAWLLRTETELTLKSRFAVPAKLLKRRFVFYYPFVDEALGDLARNRPLGLAPLGPQIAHNFKP
ncbi:TIGR01777 family oxidoreductase [Pelagicoccus sp. SDUM812002]|uniref:TIGR01777 family oxidoreductase n=1 Tax=Pelagicoccus sp. SDUM812002 TaxID=3041266 RepID=UPI00280EA07B|nr:TIGR01777 family oxidoreductase [Pelagicoccus sp. SDUM812002]MDQ8185475.1 TIGR01777 family oxidoreductase [Pelagicoccus sp. SDUM812002]